MSAETELERMGQWVDERDADPGDDDDETNVEFALRRILSATRMMSSKGLRAIASHLILCADQGDAYMDAMEEFQEEYDAAFEAGMEAYEGDDEETFVPETPPELKEKTVQRAAVLYKRELGVVLMIAQQASKWTIYKECGIPAHRIKAIELTWRNNSF